MFGSASLPVSVNTRGTYQNQVYIGMFRPDGSGAPRWMGNLKQYQFGVDTTDASQPQAVPRRLHRRGRDQRLGNGLPLAQRDQLLDRARTRRRRPTPIPPGGFWFNDPQSVGGAFDRPDGEIVEKGGVAQQLRLANLHNDYDASPGTSTNPRNVYTCTGACAAGSSLSATPFATTNADITTTALALTPPTTAASSITRNGTTVTMRLATTPVPPLTDGQQVTVAGSAYPELNGNFIITLVNATDVHVHHRRDPADAVGRDVHRDPAVHAQDRSRR